MGLLRPVVTGEDGKPEVHCILPDWYFKNRFDLPRRYKVAYGGRGSSKTWTFARHFVAESWERPLRVAVCREFGSNLNISAKRAIEGAIVQYRLQNYFKIAKWHIEGKNGSLFFFRGLKTNPTEILGWEDVDRVWVEEAHRLSEPVARILIPTIRKAGSELWFSFNPNDRSDWVWRRFILHPRERDLVVKVNWQDNPWFPDELEKERLDDKRDSPDVYAWIWEGMPNDTGAYRKVLPYGLLDACVEAYEKGLAPEGGFFEMGLDVAETGVNAATLRRGPVLEHIEKWRAQPHQTAARAHRIALDWDISRIYYDAGGVGAFLRLFYSVNPDRPYVVRPEIFGGSVKGADSMYSYRQTNGEFFSRRNSQLGWALRQRAQATRRLLDGEDVNPLKCLFINPKIPRLTEALAELSQPTWEEDMLGKIRLIKMEEDEPSPDMYDATALAFARDSDRGLRLKA